MGYLKPKQLIGLIKDCARRFVLKIYRHEASRSLFATAELLVYKALNNLSAFSLDHLSVSSQHTRASNENKFMSLPVRTVFKYSFFPRTITDWNSLPLAVRLSQSTQSFHGALLNSASSNRCSSSWHSGGNGWSAPIAGHRTEERHLTVSANSEDSWKNSVCQGLGCGA